MADKDVVIIADYTQEQPINIDELCKICGLSMDVVYVLIEYDIIQPQGNKPEDWLFDMIQLQRLKKAQRLQRDLELNMAGAAVVLDLMEEVQDLRAKMKMLEKHYLK